MMLETDINSLESKKISLEIKLNELLKDNANKDEINELKSEILYIKKQISQKLGIKEVESQEKLKRKKLHIDERNIKNYNAFKSRYKRISKMEVSTRNILKVIDIYFKEKQNVNDMVKVMGR